MRSPFSILPRAGVFFCVATHAAALQAQGPPEKPRPTHGAPAASSRNAAPSPVKDATGQLMVYPSRDVATRDVFGQLEDFSNRAGMLSRALRIRDSAWNALGLRRARPPEALPVHILCDSSLTAGASELRVLEDGRGRIVQMRLAESENIQAEVFTRLVLAAVLRELMERPPTKALPPLTGKAIPRWLVDALLHRELFPDAVQFSDALAEWPPERPFPFSLADLLSRAESDPRPPTRVEMLAARCFLSWVAPGAGEKNAVLDWLHSDPVQIPGASLNRYFQLLPRSETEMQKAWTMHLASARAQRSHLSMTRAETEAALQRLIEIDVVLPGNIRQVASLENFEEYLRVPDIGTVLRSRQFELANLASRAHFLFEPVILAYADLCADMAARRTKQLGERFRRVKAEWNSVRERLDRARDYLNWWESLPRSAAPAPELKDFYAELDASEAFRPKVSKALDYWEKRLKEKERRADWERVLDEAEERSRSKKNP